MHHEQTVEEFYARFTQIHTRCERDVHQMNQTKKTDQFILFSFCGSRILSCISQAKTGANVTRSMSSM